MRPELFPSDEELAGLMVGPESVTWRYGSDVRLFAAALYALLLQVSHPTIGAGVRDYSDFEQRPYNRLFRTLDWVNLMIYGGLDGAAAGRRLRDLHKAFRGVREDGKPYYALERDAYAWVHATLIEATVAGHQRFGRPMTQAQIEQFYREYRGLGRLIGVREGDLPETWLEFRRYFDAMVSEQLVRTESVARVIASTRAAAFPRIPGLPPSVTRALNAPPGKLVRVCGLGLLPPVLRSRFGVRWTRADELQFRAVGRIGRSLSPVLPQRLEVLGPQHLRLRRRAIVAGPIGPGYDPARWAASKAQAVGA